MTKDIYMVGDDEVTRQNMLRMLSEGLIKLEGVDGDEEEDTVTYWYRLVEEEG